MKQLQRCWLGISSKHAFAVAVIAPIFIFISMGQVTIPELAFAADRFDGIIALGGFALSLFAVIFLTNLFSKPTSSRRK